ncbi:hypothetical protein AHAS_Ahas19G0121300 [Arachis hypogaea]
MFYIHQQTQVQHPWIELYVEFEHINADEVQHNPNVQDDRTEIYEGMDNDSDEEFEATYEAGDEDEDDDGEGETVAETIVVPPAVSQIMDVPPFMCSLNLDAMHAPKFPEYANIGMCHSCDGWAVVAEALAGDDKEMAETLHMAVGVAAEE